MKAKTLIAAGCAAVVLISAAAVASAQEGHVVLRQMGPPSAEMQQHMQAQHAQMLADLRTVLRIRPDQESAFKAFGDSLAPKIFTVKKDGPQDGLTLPQMLADHAKMDAETHAAMQAHDDAVVALYNALSPDQQQVVDALMRLHHGMDGGMGGPGMDGRGMGGPGPHIIRMEMGGHPPL